MARNNTLFLVLTAVLGAAALVSCSLFEGLHGGDESAAGPKVFAHKVHVADNEMACTDCHGGAMKEAEAGMPVLATCLDCHEDPEEGSAIATAVAELTAREKDGRPLWGAKAGGDLRFHHAKHVGREVAASSGQTVKVACADCHGEVGSSETLPASTTPPMTLCTDCHAQGKKAEKEGEEDVPGMQLAACSVCHEVTRCDVRPADHRGMWRRVHGEEIKFGFDEEASRRCAYCHREDFCTACHMRDKPASHTQFFRFRGHGIDASIHRERCQTCHLEDFCVRCHSNTRPLTHAGSSWEHAPYRHCSECHLPVSMTRCSACHRYADHRYAPLYPRDSNHTANCTMACHTRQHPDPGPDCKACHK